MSRKSERCYIHLFTALKQIFDLTGESFMTDLEIAMRNAIRHVYPGARLHTCWFHFCQAAKRKAYQIPMFIRSIQANENMKSIYYKLLSLPLLPAADIMACFHMLKAQAQQIDAKSSKQFLVYFEKQWLKKVCSYL